VVAGLAVPRTLLLEVLVRQILAAEAVGRGIKSVQAVLVARAS
jgi:hypothetical protein